MIRALLPIVAVLMASCATAPTVDLEKADNTMTENNGGVPKQDSWARKHYTKPGGKPFLFFVIYGEVPAEVTISRSKYNFSGMPEGLGMMRYGPGKNPDVPDSFRTAYPWEELQKTRPRLAARIAACTSCTIIKGEFDDQLTLDYLRNVIALATWCVDNGGVCVYDPQKFTWWSPEEWRKQIFEAEGTVPRQHVVIMASEDDDGTLWYHTRGMRKFGRPDLSIHRVTGEYEDAVVGLFNRFIELQAFGGVITEGQEIRMASMPDGLTCHHGGDLDDPDFNNVHVEIRWPQKGGAQ